MLFQSLDKLKRSVIMTAIVLMFIGLILLLLPEEYAAFLTFPLVFIFSVIFAVSILNFIGTRKTLMSYAQLTLGLLSGILALAFFLFDELLLSILSWTVGILPILVGVYGIYHSFAFARRSGRKAWWILTVFSVLQTAFGGFVFCNPWMDSPEAFMKTVGGTLLYSSFVSALSMIWIWPIKNSGN